VAKLDRFLYFAALDQIGVGFKDRIDLLVGWNLLALEHSAAGLIDDAVPELTVVLDHPAQLLNGNVLHHVDDVNIFRLFEHLARIAHDVFRSTYELAILLLLLVMALLGSHALDLLHPAPCQTCVVGKPGNALGK